MSSDDEYTTDDQTRKRRPTRKEIGAEFSKSIKTMSTPPKLQNKEEKMLDTINNKSKNERLKKKNVEIKKELWELKNTVERLDREKRKNNIVLNGINIETEDNVGIKGSMEVFMSWK
ncbi:hypothetical protein ILUMI_17235, partial [Ignelater luminosus]